MKPNRLPSAVSAKMSSAGGIETAMFWTSGVSTLPSICCATK